MKINIQIWLIAIISTYLVACSNDDFAGKSALIIKADISDSGTSSGRNMSDNVVIERFIINIDEIEFEVDDDDDDDRGRKFRDVKLRGPFELELVKNGRVNEKLFAGLDIPAGRYEEIEFDIEKGRDRNSEMFGKSVLVEGKIGDMPFVYWYDDDEDFEIEFDDDYVWISEESLNEIVLNFRIGPLFKGKKGVSLTNAKDGNGDGLIEISPRDPDGNRKLASRIWDRFEDIIDAFDD
ncbi:MAG: DUF4382 domain-containing protein [Cyclobacteriaceae bacterium]|nr:DUF4382 domain-containing protein [Cyclobacteriaceae bacterium]